MRTPSLRHAVFSSLTIAAYAGSLAVVCACGGAGQAAEPASSATTGGEHIAGPAEAPLASAPTPVAVVAEPVMIDPLVASPDVFKVILEGPRARVLEGTWKPGQQDTMHGHPTLVAYAVTPIFGLTYEADDSSYSVRITQGRVLLQQAVTAHSFKNSAKEVAKMIIVELKPGQKHAKMPSDAAPDAQTASPEIFELLGVDAQVRVLLATWKPGQKDTLHGHPALTVYAITDVTGKLHEADGTTTDIDLKAGTAMFHEPTKGHYFENTGKAPAQMLLVEQRK